MYFVNGQYVREEDAKISIFDLTILRGFGVFEYFRTYGKKPFHLWDHLLRLKYSAEHIALALPHTLEEIQNIVQTVLDQCPLSEVGIKIIATGGISADQFLPQAPGQLIVFPIPAITYPQQYFTEGINVITTRLPRSLPTSKTIQYMPAIVSMLRGKAHHPKEALYLNANNEILEATTCNFFAFKNGVLRTCSTDEVLFGITREVVLKLAAPVFPIEEKALRYEEISDIEEAFITSSNREVMPVVQIDSQIIGDGRVGPKTKKLMELFHAYTKNAPWPELNIPRHAIAAPAIK